MTLKEWRNHQGLTQEEAGKVMGWPQSTYQRIEAGTTPANRDQLLEIHEATGGAVTPNDMVLGERAA